MTLETGTHLGPYEIVGPLGAGGMGEVYRAKDTRLKREVAIKVLPERLAKDPEALSRLEREAQVVAALSHPNILAIYDVGTGGETSYVVTELLQGETLRERVRRSTIPWRKAVEVGTAIADGLAAAHAKGVVHRDLKPENIFLTKDGVVKILDFGLAHVETTSGVPAADQADTPTITLDTKPGTILGTINYMSPEQVRGQRTDARSDIFSFGCVLYEMVTGRRAFTGDSPPETMTAILKHDPPDMTESGVKTAPELDRVIRRCLEKKSDQRIHSARDLGFALRDILSDSGAAKPLSAGATVWAGKAAWMAVGAVVVTLAGLAYLMQWGRADVQPTEAIDSLAVMPFVVAGGDPDAEYLGEEIPATIIDSMSQLPDLRVFPRSTVFRLAKDRTDHRQIAKELGVWAIVSGEVSQRGERLSVRVALLDARSDRQLWGKRYDRTEDDILAIEKDIAEHISDTLRMRLTGSQRTDLVRSYTDNTQAYRAYKEARFWWNKRTQAGFKRAIELYDEAIDIDPQYALAYAGKADCYCLAAWYFRPAREVAHKVIEAVDAALALDPDLPEAYPPRALVRAFVEWDWAGAERDLQRAIRLNSNYATAHHWYWLFLTARGRLDEAQREIRRARDLDPGSLIINRELGGCYLFRRRYDRAIEQYRNTLTMDPTFMQARVTLAEALKANHQYDEAIAEIQRVYEEVGRFPRAAGTLGAIYAAAGHYEQAREELRALVTLSRQQYVPAVAFALIHAELGEHDAAFARMDEAFEARDAPLALLAISPRFDALRADPRFDDLLRRIGLEDVPRPATDVGAIRPNTGRITLAVLPFENVSSDPDTEYLSNEIPASIISRLSRLSGLSVVPRNSAFRFDASREDASSFGKRLGSSVVLTGQLNARGTGLSIRAELVDVASNRELWSDRYNRTLTDVMALEAEITQSLSQALRIQLTAKERTRLAKAKTVNPDAYRSYLQGRFWWSKFTADGYHKALQYFQQAIEEDPTYAPAYAELANTYILMGGWYGGMPPRGAFPKAEEAAVKALEIDPTLAEAHRSLGFIRLVYEWDWQGAEQAFVRAIGLNPDSATAHSQYALLLHAMGRFGLAQEERERALELDPLSPIIHSALAWGHTQAGEYEQAVNRFTETLRLHPGFPPALAGLGFVYLSEKKHEEAITAFRQAGLQSRNASFLGWLGLAYARAGKRTDAVAILGELERASTTGHGRVPAAMVHAALGDAKRAFELLETAYNERESELVWLNTMLPFDSLRTDRRFDDLLRRIGFEPNSIPQTTDGLPDAKIRLVVLPFENVSPEPQEWFSDAMTGELIATLGRIKALGVISRTSAMRYRSTDKTLQQIARELNVSKIVEGSVLRIGGRVRITVELIDAVTDTHLWSNSYEHELRDILALQGEVARAIAREVQVKLTPQEQARMVSVRQVNPGAYEAYVKGRYYWNRRTEEGLKKSIPYFEEAIDKDPSYALAYAGLADAWIVLGFNGHLLPREAMPGARTAALKALEIDDGLGEAHASLAAVQYSYDWDFPQAEIEFKRALELNPSYATGHQWYSQLLLSMGRHNEAFMEIRRAQELDPLSLIINITAASNHYLARQYDQALEECRKTLELDPTFLWVHWMLGTTYEQKGMRDQAIVAYQRYLRNFFSATPEEVAAYGRAYATGGMNAARRWYLKYLEEESAHRHVPPFAFAMNYALLDERDKAFEWLEKAYDQRDPFMTDLNTAPGLDNLRDDPRFDNLLRRIGPEPPTGDDPNSVGERPK